MVNFQHCIFFRLSNTYKFYACFLLDITCTPVPANELVSICCNLDRVSILVSILHLSKTIGRIAKQYDENVKNLKFVLLCKKWFPW